MSALDTPVYHRFLAKLRPPNLAESIVVDVGAGDGRNTAPWLAWGFKRVVAVDAVCASLARFRQRIRRQHPAWLDRILMVECDARQIPLSSAQADIVIAIESLYYLNEDYPRGLAECVRIMKPNGRIFLAERSWEGALLARLLYSGVGAMLSIAKSRDMWDGGMQDSVRSRCFTETELIAMLRGRGLEPLEVKGIPLLPLILGYLRSQGSLKRGDGKLLGRLGHLLQDLGEHGQMRRTYAVVAAKASARVRARQ
ncbi:MAG TPA: class I SAM-dependent methyltransferase [Candidatus Binataceae bacterium]|nr:class I SAM-dependent methyltransferase [Candidatus Binataceae bacterium]